MISARLGPAYCKIDCLSTHGCLSGFICYVNMAARRQRSGTVIFISLDAPLLAISGVLVTPITTELPHTQIHNCLVNCETSVLFKIRKTNLSRISHHLNFQQRSYIFTEQLSRYSNSLRAGRYGDRIPMEARFPAPVQTDPVAHPASFTEGTESLSGIKLIGCGVNLPPYLAVRLKEECSSTSISALCLHAYFCKRGINEKFSLFLFNISKLSHY
jgi:hypothetical protein